MSKHYPLTSRTLDQLWGLMDALAKETLPAAVQDEFKRVYDALLTHDLEQVGAGSEKQRTRAINEKHRDGECEVDSDAVVAWGDDDGAYVMCWTWVSGVLEDREESEVGP